eukprot:6184466-Pleurochrysis_carterae.AAC.2
MKVVLISAGDGFFVRSPQLTCVSHAETQQPGRCAAPFDAGRSAALFNLQHEQAEGGERKGAQRPVAEVGVDLHGAKRQWETYPARALTALCSLPSRSALMRCALRGEMTDPGAKATGGSSRVYNALRAKACLNYNSIWLARSRPLPLRSGRTRADAREGSVACIHASAFIGMSATAATRVR